eukprot:5530126-Amphidinium_carterae.1
MALGAMAFGTLWGVSMAVVEEGMLQKPTFSLNSWHCAVERSHFRILVPPTLPCPQPERRC